ncbi:hypothetical protein LshimejAT787_0308340 [Lyophyllum shimeji]|uniref:Uncharacterized protein n=1 Tax=Lyophyllum shimeji TaxID=47721 RepID=A0A9P3PIS6_LYOSH|nr:hypothetical protein LshimejAT787_0308340 [Lyophyllum shimeji]
MARATRSSVLQPAAAKRKRQDAVDDDNDNAQPPAKLLRHDHGSPPPVPAEHAAAILDVLEMTDTQGLLDRVFPVLDHPERSASLRALLADPQPLPVLRAAVQHLFPISSLPRAKPSPTVAQQLRFCSLAVSLLDQASKHTTPIPLTLDSILPPKAEPSEPRPLKYALVQHLPNQDYWTSLNSDAALTSSLQRLPTAHSELVAIFPTPASAPKKPVPTLGSYVSTRPLASVKPLPAHRTVTTGTFLDYGPWSSFAPSFDHNAEVVGRRELGFALYASHEKRQKRMAALREAQEGRGSIEEVFSEPLTAPEAVVVPEREGESQAVDLDNELQELLPPEEVAAIKAALGSLELENAVYELLERNRRALVRLEELQIARLIKEGEHSKAEEGSEEWDTAQGILDSLAVLASLRPRISTKAGEKTPVSIVPPPAVLHRLHRTLALEPTQGWYGTLPDTITARPMALRDDTTVKKSRVAPVPTTTPTPAATAAATPAATHTTTTTAPVPAATPVAMPYSGYTYAYGAAAQQQQQQPYRPAVANGVATQQAQYAQYTPQYYSYAAPTPQHAGATAPMQQSYYGQQQQGYAAAAFSGWYNAAAAAYQQQAGGTASGSATPQPQAVGTATYGSFFGGARTPAVANTVTYQATTTGQGTPTVMPPHLRSAAAQGGGQAGYYPTAAYHQPAAPSAAASPGVGR